MRQCFRFPVLAEDVIGQEVFRGFLVHNIEFVDGSVGWAEDGEFGVRRV